MKIPFKKPYCSGKELEYIKESVLNGNIPVDFPNILTNYFHWLDTIGEIIMFIELDLIKIGIKLPFGGSLLLLAGKKK